MTKSSSVLVDCYTDGGSDLIGDGSLVWTQIGSEEILDDEIVTRCSVADGFHCSVAIEGAWIVQIHSQRVK